MRLNLLNKLHRRFIIRHFGSVRSFVVWLVIVISCIYLLDCCILTKDRIESLLGARSVSRQVLDVQNLKSPQPVSPVAALPSSTVITIANISKSTPPDVPKLSCGLKKPCPAGQYPYHIMSGFKRSGLPTICFNGNYVIDQVKGNANRGLNMVVINDKTLVIEDIRTFDVYQDDTVLLRYLKLGIQNNHLIMIASQDEASYHLSEESKKHLEGFGSVLINNIKFRDSFVMFGQKGLSKGSAIEKLLPRTTGADFSDPVTVEGCTPIPLVQLDPNNEKEPVPKKKKVPTATLR